MAKTTPTPPEKLQAIMADLSANAMPQLEIARKYGVHPSTVTRVKQRCVIEIRKEKKDVPQPHKTDAGDFRSRAESAIARSFEFLDDSKLRKCSALQLATIVGILRDKLRDMEARQTVETISMRWQTRDEMLAYLQNGKGDEAAAASAPKGENGQTSAQSHI